MSKENSRILEMKIKVEFYKSKYNNNTITQKEMMEFDKLVDDLRELGINNIDILNSRCNIIRKKQKERERI